MMKALGIDPGVRNFAAASSTGDCFLLSKDKGEELFHFLSRVFSMVEQISAEYDIVVIERQFDKAAYKPLEKVECTSSLAAFTGGERKKRFTALTFSPSQMKKYVTGKGNADESLFWRTVEKKISRGVFPSIENQHCMEAAIYALMGEDWVMLQQDETWKARGLRETLKPFIVVYKQ